MNKKSTLLEDLPMQAYLELKDYLGGSALGLLLQRPDFFDYRYNQGNHEEDTNAIKLGKLTHTLFMEPDKVEDEYHLIPPTFINKKGGVSNWVENLTWKHVKKDIKAAGNKCRVTMAQLDESMKLANALIKNDYARDIVNHAKVEPTMLVKNSSVWFKSRPDLMQVENAICDNIKTSDSVEPEKFYRKAVRYGYDISAAMTAYCFEAIFDRPLKDYRFIVVEKSDTNPVEVFSSNVPMYGEGSMTFLQFGAVRLKAAINMYRECKQNNHWPAVQRKTQMNAMRVPYNVLKEYLDGA